MNESEIEEFEEDEPELNIRNQFIVTVASAIVGLGAKLLVEHFLGRSLLKRQLEDEPKELDEG